MANDNRPQRPAQPGQGTTAAPSSTTPAPPNGPPPAYDWYKEAAAYLRSRGWEAKALDARQNPLWEDPLALPGKPVYYGDTKRYAAELEREGRGVYTKNAALALRHKETGKPLIASTDGDVVPAARLSRRKDDGTGGGDVIVYQLRVPSARTLMTTEAAVAAQKARDAGEGGIDAVITALEGRLEDLYRQRDAEQRDKRQTA